MKKLRVEYCGRILGHIANKLQVEIILKSRQWEKEMEEIEEGMNEKDSNNENEDENEDEMDN